MTIGAISSSASQSPIPGVAGPSKKTLPGFVSDADPNALPGVIRKTSQPAVESNVSTPKTAALSPDAAAAATSQLKTDISANPGAAINIQAGALKAVGLQ